MIELRGAVAQDEPFLRAMLAEAADWRPDSMVRSGDAVLRDQAVARYLAGWPMEGDFGVIAHDDGVPVGATWCRFFTADHCGYGYVASDVPELTIGVIADRRGHGIGRRLLTELAVMAGGHSIERISLSVEIDNPAIHLYADVGFVEVAQSDGAATMILDCLQS